jgi:hypothetical protein
MAFDRAAAKEAGYTDEEINAYLQANPEVAKDTPPAPAGKDEPPAPSTKISDVDHTASTLATVGMGAGNFVAEHPYLTGAAALAAGKALGLGGPADKLASKVIPGYDVAKSAVGAAQEFTGRYGERTAVQEFNTLMNNYTKMNHDIRQYVKDGKPVPQSLLDAQTKLGQQIEAAQARIPTQGGPVNPATAPGTAPAPTAPAQAAGAIAPEAEAAAQAARTAAAPTNAISSGFSQQLQNLSRGGANILGRISPYLEAAGRIAAPVARVAGPVGMAASAYEAYPYLQQAQIGPRTQSGEVKQMVNAANRMALNMPTAAPLSATEARNLLDSGDERTIKIYGGRQRLQQIINAGK